MSNPNSDQPNAADAPSMRENRAPSGYVKASGVEDPDEPSGGVNLTLVYSLLAVALLAAIVIALFIVLPFYRH